MYSLIIPRRRLHVEAQTSHALEVILDDRLASVLRICAVVRIRAILEEAIVS